MSTGVRESEVLEFLRAVEAGEVTLVPQQDPQDVYAGNVAYSASNGWVITIFNDCNEWDYIDHLRTPDGRESDYDRIWAEMPRVDAYEPSDSVAWARYRIPGYLKFRCVECGRLLERQATPRAHYFCTTCAGFPGRIGAISDRSLDDAGPD